ncbi:Uncharacterized conserved protein YehS, DUF1456 family [Formivibrio citricus]|uniref:Uncharacterized conserved protein YehS, DUF1456 family n=1 Tax=Formivibrio citricus TaxID=83765 RepID=A0A1I5DL47_9NEIS|nr:DUF1456 family protein [Formivibrio citricus]SFN99979.1 Uncharacterized conserved protein YehS, DUF1456 family [Formivibrio citricus]
MTNNDILRSLRYALDISDVAVAKMIALAEQQVDKADIIGMMKKEDEEGYLPCSNAVLTAFLDGLIVQKRGKMEPKPGQAPEPVSEFNYNLVLKKIRIALELKEDDILAMLELANFRLSKPELSALFRKPDHKNYRPCKEQFLRNFLKGLALRLRAADGA